MNRCAMGSKFLLERSKTSPDQPIYDLTQNSKEQGRPSLDSNLFSSFLYRDHVTRYRYEISKLKSIKKSKTCPSQNSYQPSNELTFLNDQLKLLQIIKETRNKELIQSSKQKSLQKSTKRSKLIQSNQYDELDKVKRKIRRQVLNLNHEFLREYLYHQQPFNEMLVEINRYSNAGIINQQKISQLKRKIMKCMERRGDENKYLSKQQLEQRHKKLSLKKQSKRQKERQMDKKFEQIWDELRKQIGCKVRMEGQYNLYRRMLK